MRRRPQLFLVLMAVAAACARSVRVPDLGALYSAAARRDEPGRNPVIDNVLYLLLEDARARGAHPG